MTPKYPLKLEAVRVHTLGHSIARLKVGYKCNLYLSGNIVGNAVLIKKENGHSAYFRVDIDKAPNLAFDKLYIVMTSLGTDLAISTVSLSGDNLPLRIQIINQKLLSFLS